jgi:predicted nucleic acid-binding protein
LIVLDASAAIAWLIQSPSGLRIENRICSVDETLHAPHLLDVEVAQVLRRLARQDTISAQRADAALQALFDLRVVRHSHADLLPRIWQLRHNLSAYDAAYVSLAELIGAPLITRDSRLAAAPGHLARVELF